MLCEGILIYYPLQVRLEGFKDEFEARNIDGLRLLVRCECIS